MHSRIAYLVHDLGDAAVARRVEGLQAGGGAVALAGFYRRAAPASIAGAPALAIGRSHDGRLAARALLVLRRLLFPGKLRAMVRGAAAAANVRVVDCGARFVTADGVIKRSLMPDYTHPSPKGYVEWKGCLAGADAAAEAELQKAVAAGYAPVELARGGPAGRVRVHLAKGPGAGPGFVSPGAEKLKRIAATSLHLKRPQAATG